MNPIDVAKEFIAKNHPHMMDATVTTVPHDQSVDAHVMQFLDGVNESHLDTDPSDMVTAQKQFTTEDGAQIAKILKMQVKNDQVVSAMESK